MHPGYEGKVREEMHQYLGVNPACIAILQDNTRMLVWGIQGIPGEQYHTMRWFSDMEKLEIQEQIEEGNMKAIQDFLKKYI